MNRPRSGRPASPVGAIFLITELTLVGILPFYIIGVLIPILRTDLNLLPTQLAGVSGSYFAGAALGGLLMGGWADRLGAVGAIVIACGGIAASSLAIATVVAGFSGLAVALFAAGAFASLGHSATNRLLVFSMSPRILGRGFAIKNSAQPVAAFLAGGLVPILVTTIGWRSSFFAVFGGSGLVAMHTWRVRSRIRANESDYSRAEPRRQTMTDGQRVRVLPTAIVNAVGVLGISNLGTHLTTTGVAVGLSFAAAGLLVTLGGFVAVIGRVWIGELVPRFRGREMYVVAGLLALGGLGYSLIATGHTWALIAGVVVAFAFGWSWSLILLLAAADQNPATAGRVTGQLMFGGYLGSVAGPLMFALVEQRSGISAAWGLVAASAFVATALALYEGKQSAIQRKTLSEAK